MLGGGRDSGDIGYYLSLAQVGFEMVVPIVIGVYLDEHLGWAPWGAAAGAVLGLVGGLAHLIYVVNRSGDGRRPPR